MRQQFEKMMIMVQQALQGSNVNNNGAQAIDPAIPANNQDIIILGGYNAPGIESISNTVKKYSIVEGKSTQLPPMNLARATSASCVYNGDVIVTGGFSDRYATRLAPSLSPWVLIGYIQFTRSYYRKENAASPPREGTMHNLLNKGLFIRSRFARTRYEAG